MSNLTVLIYWHNCTTRFSINSVKILVAKNPAQTFVKDGFNFAVLREFMFYFEGNCSDLQYKYCSIELSYMSCVFVSDLGFLYLACVVHHDIRHCYVYHDELLCKTAVCIFFLGTFDQTLTFDSWPTCMHDGCVIMLHCVLRYITLTSKYNFQLTLLLNMWHVDVLS